MIINGACFVPKVPWSSKILTAPSLGENKMVTLLPLMARSHVAHLQESWLIEVIDWEGKLTEWLKVHDHVGLPGNSKTNYWGRQAITQ